MKTPESFVNKYNGKKVNRGNGWNDSQYGYQCVAGFKAGCEYLGIPVIPTPNNWADGYWTCLNKDGSPSRSTEEWQRTYFDKVHDFIDGDWVIWAKGSESHPSSHVAMYYHGQEFGQNQGGDGGFCLKKTDFSDALGALRPKMWATLPAFESDITVNGHAYFLYGQSAGLTPVVLSPGLNKVCSIHEMDVNHDVYLKITGCNFYQANKSSRDYGMTFGDISAPLNGVYQNLPNQSSTMYFDIETGMHGDCTGVNIDSDHNVFSPVLIYEHGKNVQYARMVGLDHCHHMSRYAFLIRQTDGTYAAGLAAQDLTPDQIWEDMQTVPGVQQIAIIDGGNSACMMRYRVKDRRVEYLHDTGTPTAGCIAFISGNISEPQNQAPQGETHESEEETMPEEKTQETSPVEIVDGWKDPEPQSNLLKERLAALLSVKSILTLTLTLVFAYLVMKQIAIPDFFSEIYKLVVMFFFGYQSGKAGSK